SLSKTADLVHTSPMAPPMSRCRAERPQNRGPKARPLKCSPKNGLRAQPRKRRRSKPAMRLGVLDIESNTIHLLLVDAFPGARPNAYADHKRPMSLIQHLDDDGAITEQGQASLIEFINGAVAFAKANGAVDMISFCTSAIRDAANGKKVLERIGEETGVHLTVLSGDQEAAMTYFAVRRWH